jgi:hypothetical protein
VKRFSGNYSFWIAAWIAGKNQDADIKRKILFYVGLVDHKAKPHQVKEFRVYAALWRAGS